MLVKQNDAVKSFAMANNSDDHFKMLNILPTRNNPTQFQVLS